MTISESSPLRILPTQLNKEQVFFIDGIRYSILMVESAYSRLESLATEITNDFTKGTDANANLILIDSWVMVDSINRIRALLMAMPGGLGKSSQVTAFLRETEDFKKVRNGMQHLDERVRKFAAINRPVLGDLFWVVLDHVTKGLKVFLVHPGTESGNFTTSPFKVSDFSEIGIGVDHLTFKITVWSEGAAQPHSLRLTMVFEQLQRLTSFLEATLKKSFVETFGENYPHNHVAAIKCLEFR